MDLEKVLDKQGVVTWYANSTCTHTVMPSEYQFNHNYIVPLYSSYNFTEF